jgi:hypothetical protein
MTSSRLGLTVIFALALMPAVAFAHDVVVNEVMYKPYGESTVGRYEFIEIYNHGSEPVDLGGTRLTDSQDWLRICHFQHPLDYEGVFEIPAGTVIGPGEYLTFWHTHIPGVTDQPGNVVYDHFEYFGNLVLANGGDQVTLFTCDAAANPVIIDSLDYSQFDLSNLHNRSLERISPFAPTQDESNWGYTTANAGGPQGGGYVPGGTPGAINTIANF